MSPQECSGRTLAFLGDAVWSLLVRDMLVEKGEGRGSSLQKASIAYVNAHAQAAFYEALHAGNFFSEEEEAYFRRGRNGHAEAHPKHTSVQVYRLSTGFEAILGALYLNNDRERIKKIWEECVRLKEAGYDKMDLREERD